MSPALARPAVAFGRVVLVAADPHIGGPSGDPFDVASPPKSPGPPEPAPLPPAPVYDPKLTPRGENEPVYIPPPRGPTRYPPPPTGPVPRSYPPPSPPGPTLPPIESGPGLSDSGIMDVSKGVANGDTLADGYPPPPRDKNPDDLSPRGEQIEDERDIGPQLPYPPPKPEGTRRQRLRTQRPEAVGESRDLRKEIPPGAGGGSSSSASGPTQGSL